MALNGSGRAPAKANLEWYAKHAIRHILSLTAHAVTILGAADAWWTLNEAYCSSPPWRAADDGYRIVQGMR